MRWARQLGVPSIYVEREGGVLTFRRAFGLAPGARVAMVEDIVSTGLSSRECVQAIQAAGGEVVCAACIVDRSGGRADSGVPMIALATLDVPAYPQDALPPELAAIAPEDPGSRRLSA
jgi:orotate phosphoribosyltransferase